MDNNTILNERYQIIRPIGYGGMAEVYLAHDQLLDRNVAVKRLRDQFLEDKELLEQFRREAKSAARLVHPYIINVYDVISQGDDQYIVMEYVDGVTLKEFMQQGRLTLHDTLEIGVRLAEGLQHAHSRHVIHCDIKPQNILIDKNLVPKIADFGIAKMVSNQTMVYSKSVMGSVHYISPEQVDGGKITASSDVYSLGVVLFEMLTGQVPYMGSTAMAVAMMHLEKPIPQLSEYMDDVPEGLQAIMNKVLAKRSEDRYADAGELGRDLFLLKRRLFPDGDESSQTMESFTAALPIQPVNHSEEAANYDTDATVVMNPMRYTQTTGLDDQATTVLTPVKRTDNSASVVEESKGGGDVTESTPKKKKKLNYTRLLLLITAVVVCISMAANFFLNGNLKEVQVPEVTNMTVVEAQRLLEDKGFRVELKEEYGDPEKYKPGTVMLQSPKANETRKEKSLVVLTISKGAELKAVPNVVGSTYQKAEQLLMDAGFKIGKVERKFDSSQRIGIILSQSIKATDKAPKGSEVNLVLNEGDKAVPNLVGKKLTEVKGLLEQAGLKLGEIKRVQDASATKDVVLATNPNAGTNLAEGTAVSITVAEGSGQKTGYVEFSIPGNKSVKVEIVMTDDNGQKSLYSGTQKGGVRIRQRVEYVGKAEVQLLIDGRSRESKRLQ